MKIDLSDKIQCFLVQEYVNKICHYESEEELNWDVHKLIHTFQVVQMAQKLIEKSKENLSQKLKKEIINACVLHDLGRCYEFKKGKHLKLVDHGVIGSRLILKKFPKMIVEAKTTQFHNKAPSSKDPKMCAVVLDYVRDADMLGNLQYNVEHFNMFVQHVLMNQSRKVHSSVIDREIINSLKENRPVNIKAIKEFQNMLISRGVTTTIRRTLGADIDASCGQLRQREGKV